MILSSTRCLLPAVFGESACPEQKPKEKLREQGRFGTINC
jgi:hypothetical protein